jgi:hypothetical protein
MYEALHVVPEAVCVMAQLDPFTYFCPYLILELAKVGHGLLHVTPALHRRGRILTEEVQIQVAAWVCLQGVDG